MGLHGHHGHHGHHHGGVKATRVDRGRFLAFTFCRGRGKSITTVPPPPIAEIIYPPKIWKAHANTYPNENSL
jgi:hypothetical protein